VIATVRMRVSSGTGPIETRPSRSSRSRLRVTPRRGRYLDRVCDIVGTLTEGPLITNDLPIHEHANRIFPYEIPDELPVKTVRRSCVDSTARPRDRHSVTHLRTSCSGIR
jgi:hypothetical protein